MKNILILTSVLLMLISCGSSNNYKYNREEETPLKGTWVVQDVKYSEDDVKVTAFGIADAQCFVSSAWTFVPNNHTGKMIAGASNNDCPTVDTDYTWYIDANDVFHLKPISGGMKAKNVKDGYLFKIHMDGENNFTLLQTANLDGSPVYITYNFVKQ